MDGGGNILAVNESALLQLGCSTRKSAGRRVDREIFPSSTFATLEGGRNSNRVRFGRCGIWRTAGGSSRSRGRRCARRREPWSWPRRIPLPKRPRHAARKGSTPCRRRCAMRKNLTFGRQLFAKQVPILLQGATGTARKRLAKALHHSGCGSTRHRDRQLRRHPES